MTATLQRHRFTVADYHRLGDAGVLAEDDRVELIDGDIVEMSPIGSSHAGLVNRLTRWFVEHVSDRALVSVQNPLRIGARSEPQPDLLLLKPRPDDYLDDHPQPADVLLLVEVAESSYQDKVKVTFYKGVSLDDPAGLFDASLNGNTRRAIDLHEGDEIDERAFKALVRAAAALNASRA